MAYSKVSISNMSLAYFGVDSIRAMDEDNKRARLCSVFFDPLRDLLLQRFDWPFARGFIRLQQLAEDFNYPDNVSVYQVPNDCAASRDIWPRGGRDDWEVVGNTIHCRLDAVYLYYTKQIQNPALFSHGFVHILAMLMATKIGMPLTADAQAVAGITRELPFEMNNVLESEMNMGNVYKAYNDDPNKDTFVNPDEILGFVDTVVRV